MLHSEVESRMFYVWKYIRKPKEVEKNWYEVVHGSDNWRDIEITHNQNRIYINHIQKELKKRKIEPKKEDPKTINIIKYPQMKDGVYVSYLDKEMAQQKIDEWDKDIISNYNELKPILEELLKSDNYGYYVNMLLEICLPTFICDEFIEKNYH